MILGISGKRGTGKSLLAKYLTEIGWREMSFARELKRRVREDFGLGTEHTDGSLKEQPTHYIRRSNCTEWTPREIMIEYGQFFRSVDPDFWVKQIFKHIDRIPLETAVVIPDVRFLNEAQYIKYRGGMLVRLERDPKINIYKEELNDASECELDNYPGFNMIIPKEANNFPEDLQFLAKRIQLLGERNALH
jgi:hypothetical protein